VLVLMWAEVRKSFIYMRARCGERERCYRTKYYYYGAQPLSLSPEQIHIRSFASPARIIIKQPRRMWQRRKCDVMLSRKREGRITTAWLHSTLIESRICSLCELDKGFLIAPSSTFPNVKHGLKFKTGNS
jgi:hypothetical protein